MERAPTQQERDSIIREAKKHLREVVRNDWNYETSLKNIPPSSDPATNTTAATAPSTPPSSSSPVPPTTTTATSSATTAAGPLADVVGWRLREYDSSSSEADTEQAGPARAAGQHHHQHQHHRHEPDQQDDKSDAAVRASVVERRRRRRRQLEEEMQWNVGLKIWVERRNAWSGARRRADVQRAAGEQAAPSAAQEVDQKKEANASLVRPISYESAGSHSTVPAEGEEQGDQASHPSSDDSSLAAETEALSLGDSQHPISKQSSSEPATASTTEGEQSTEEEKEKDDEDPDEPLIPLVRPLIPDSNPIRASIRPSLYPSIYSKIVVQGLTPTVPINLADVTRAIVQGWKADGQWPPKPTPQLPGDNIITHRRVNGGNAANITIPNHNDEKNKKSHGVADAVKKVLGLSGIHHSPFHRRGSSHDDGANDVPFVEETRHA